jgi:murein L,D-transpeptidase YafK
MRKIIFFLALLSSLNAQDILTLYRNNGMKDIQQALDLELASKDYWNELLAKIDTKFGFIESKLDIITCDKKTASIELNLLGKDNVYHKANSYSAFTGKYSGDKTNEGDYRTPTGIYNIVKKLNKVDPYYGPLAFVTSYPNLYDSYNNKNGHGIWIHGVPENQHRNDFTKGCIALDNKDLLCLDRTVNYNKTLVIINDSKIKTYPSKSDLSTILSNFYAWRYAWIYNDTEKYLSFYDPSFKRYDGMRYEEFKRFKTRVFEKKEQKDIDISNITVIPYPNYEKNLYEINFNEEYHSDTVSFNGPKSLIIRFTNNQMKILTEK